MGALEAFYNTYKSLEYKYKKSHSPKARIVHPMEVGEKVTIYMKECVENVRMIPVYSFIRNGSFDIELPEICLWKFNNGLLFADSDMVVLEGERVVYPKYFNYNYNKSILKDRNFVSEDKGVLTYIKYKRERHFTTVFSMIGKYSHVWAHALVEYYPKLSVLQNAIDDSDEKITVLVPRYKDQQLREIVFGELAKYDVNVEIVEENETIFAEKIYYMERPTKFTDHEVSVALGDQLIPKKTVETVRTMLVEPKVKKVSVSSKYKKIFLPRRGGFGKGIVNGQEVEDYFKMNGFQFVEPHKVTLDEKIQIFQSAEIIVGPFGSAFTNLIFCKPGTKVLIFSNYQRVFENYFSMPLQYYGVDIHYVTGYDEKLENPAHCSFQMPMDKVVSASKLYGVVDE